jgi:hypothetical protein
VNDAARQDTVNDAAGRPPPGAGPNRKPMSCAVFAPGAWAASLPVCAYRLRGAARRGSRKYPPARPAYRLAILAFSTTGSSCGCAPE